MKIKSGAIQLAFPILPHELKYVDDKKKVEFVRSSWWETLRPALEKRAQGGQERRLPCLPTPPKVLTLVHQVTPYSEETRPFPLTRKKKNTN